jgi:ribonuclease HI
MRLHIYTDGAARGNPGPAAVGVVIYNDSGEILEKHRKYLGNTTNNVAEYQGLLEGLTLAKKYLPCSVSVYMDSELVVNQMRGIYRVKNQGLLEYFRIAQQMLGSFESVDFVNVPREKNKLADQLANQALNTVEATQKAQENGHVI